MPKGSRLKANITNEHPGLLEALCACRKRPADEHGIPPYMVFHECTLMEIFEQQPTRESELLYINGVGEAKLDKFGEDFLDVICEYLG